MNSNFRGGEYRKKRSGSKWSEAHAFLKQTLPVTQAAWDAVWIPQPALLGDEQDMDEIANAVPKIQKNIAKLKNALAGGHAHD